MIPRRLFVLFDFFTLYVSFVVAYQLWPFVHRLAMNVRLPARFGPIGNGTLPPLAQLAWVFIPFALAVLFFLALTEAYAPLLRQSRTRAIGACLFAPAAATGVLTTSLFALRRTDWSRLFVFLIPVVSIAALLVLRMSLRLYLRIRSEAGFYAKNVLLIGQPQGLAWLASYFRENVSPAEYKLIGYLTTNGTCDELDLPKLGRVHDLGELLIRTPIHEVLAVQPANGGEWLPEVIENCDAMGVLVRIVAEGLLLGKMKVLKMLYPTQLLRFPAVIMAPPHFDSDALFFKRAFDIIVSTLLLIVLSPLFLLIAIAIKLNDAKAAVFYRWQVVGRNGVRFTGFKFTTMYSDADERRKELLDLNEMTGPVFKIKRDPRVTPLGRFLRKFSLNELPQLWSVLKGDMSLVGPRPAFPHELEGYGFWHKRKLSIRPGITCLWQVRGRNRISNFDDWVKMDLEYIDNWSLWLDFKILMWTAWAVVGGTGS